LLQTFNSFVDEICLVHLGGKRLLCQWPRRAHTLRRNSFGSLAMLAAIRPDLVLAGGSWVN
jgi:hypothetical protein